MAVYVKHEAADGERERVKGQRVSEVNACLFFILSDRREAWTFKINIFTFIYIGSTLLNSCYASSVRCNY